MRKSMTMTATEAANEMRRYGIKATATKVVDGIEQGRYPFGTIFNTSKNRRCVEIWRTDFERWILSVTPKEA